MIQTLVLSTNSATPRLVKLRPYSDDMIYIALSSVVTFCDVDPSEQLMNVSVLKLFFLYQDDNKLMYYSFTSHLFYIM